MVYNCSYPFSSLVRPGIYTAVIALCFILFVVLFYKARIYEVASFGPKIAVLGVLAIASGGFYNLIARYLNGCVKDPLSFFGIFSFNYADILISAGTLSLLFLYARAKLR